LSSSQQFDVDLKWRAGSNAPAPRSIAETNGGTSSGKLLVAAIATSFGSDLAETLRTSGLPYSVLDVHAEGLVAGEICAAATFATITVSPTIRDADTLRRQGYEQAAVSARNHCRIGRSIRGNVAYVVGAVCLVGSPE
jgi:organic hydroperoxide reductase OsmC/OhrA